MRGKWLRPALALVGGAVALIGLGRAYAAIGGG